MSSLRPLSSLIQRLDLHREDEIPNLAPLEESFRDSPAFWASLAEHARQYLPPALRTRKAGPVDIYADAVARHAGTDRVALRHYDRRAGFRALSFAELDARASASARAWAAQGVAPGDTIAILFAFGPDWLVAFAAALRLGACVSFLPTEHDLHLAARLEALAPKHLVFDPRRPPPVGTLEKLLLAATERGGPHAAPPYAFAPDEPCARLFSAVHAPADAPVDLAAELAYQNALRDAVLAYRIGPDTTLAAPGIHPQQHLPALLLSTLLAGATFVHLPVEDLERDPGLWTASPIHTLLVSPALADLLREKPLGPPPGLRHFLRPVDEPLDWTAVRGFVEKNKLDEIPATNVLVDAAAGGCVLFSTRRPGSVSARVLPSAGRPFTLVDAASGEETVANHGLFVPLPCKKPLEEGWFILARVGAEYLYGSARLPRRAARIFPEDEVVALAAREPFVRGACVAPMPTGPSTRFSFVLVVFTGAFPGEDRDALAAERKAILERALRERLGPDAAPDCIEIVPFWPPMDGKKVDMSKCRAQYRAGRLARKAQHPVLLRLAELRGLVIGQ
jgi:hypothetical protein